MKLSTALAGTLSLFFSFSNGQPVESQPTDTITGTDLIVQEGPNSTSALIKRDAVAVVRFFQYANCQGNVLQLNIDQTQVNAGYVNLDGYFGSAVVDWLWNDIYHIYACYAGSSCYGDPVTPLGGASGGYHCIVPTNEGWNWDKFIITT